MPTLTPDMEATEVAMAQALEATLTALAPTSTMTPEPTETAALTVVLQPSKSPEPTWTSTLTATPRSTPTATLVPVATPTVTAAVPVLTVTRIPASTPMPKPTITVEDSLSLEALSYTTGDLIGVVKNNDTKALDGADIEIVFYRGKTIVKQRDTITMPPLARFWLSDTMPYNSETATLKQGMKALKRDWLIYTGYHPAVVVSYSDAEVGHSGTIYKAANFQDWGFARSARLADVGRGYSRNREKWKTDRYKGDPSGGGAPRSSTTKKMWVYFLRKVPGVPRGNPKISHDRNAKENV